MGFFYHLILVDFITGTEFVGAPTAPFWRSRCQSFSSCFSDTMRFCKLFISSFNVFLYRNSEHFCDDYGLALSRWAMHR